MRSDNEDIGAVFAYAMDLRHGFHGVLEMFDDVRHEDAGETIAFERPRVPVQVPNNVGGRVGRAVDAHRAGFLLAGSTADIECVCMIDHEVVSLAA